VVRLLLSLVLALLALPCQAAPSPEQIIDAFFGPNPGPNRAASYTGEMKERYSDKPTFGQMLLPGRHYTASRRASSPANAPIYDVTIDNGRERLHWYADFIREEGTLKLRAVRPAERKGAGDSDLDDVAAPARGR
jgi:hypothetical protein